MKAFTGACGMDPQRNPKKPEDNGLRSASLLLAIPTLLLVSPLVGFFLGRFADARFKTAPWLTFIGLVLVFVPAGRDTYFIILRVHAGVVGYQRRRPAVRAGPH